MDNFPSMFYEAYNKKRVFVTGHTGFKGSWLAMWLTMLGAEVWGYALAPAYDNSHFELLKLGDSIHHVEGDIRDFEFFSKVMNEARPDFVFHLAAQALVREAYRDPKATFDINIGGSVNVLEAVRRCESVRSLVYITSDKCYRNAEWEWGYRENDPLGGKDPYSASKASAELVFSSYLASYFLPESHSRAASTRAGNVIGGGDWARDRIVPDTVRSLIRSEPIQLRNPGATRPWQHVLEPLGGYLLLGSRLIDEDGSKFQSSWNFGPGKGANKTVKELVTEIIRIWGSGNIVTRQTPDGPPEDRLLQLNCEKAFHWLRWQPTWNFWDSVKQTSRWYKGYADGANVRAITESQIRDYMDCLVKARHT